MNLGTMRTDVRSRIGEDVADFWSDAEINRRLNEAKDVFLGAERWPWLYTAATGSLTVATNTVNLQPGVEWSAHFDVFLTNTAIAYPLVPKRVSPPEGVQARRRFYNVSGPPAYYYIVSESSSSGVFTPVAYFVPTADLTYTVNYTYIRSVVDMSADGDVPEVPTTYHRALCAYAAGMCWLKELTGSTTKSREQFGMYNELLDMARRDYLSPADDEIVAWGKDEPEGRAALSEDDWARSRIPGTLG